jgi:hypothetical protein
MENARHNICLHIMLSHNQERHFNITRTMNLIRTRKENTGGRSKNLKLDNIKMNRSVTRF